MRLLLIMVLTLVAVAGLGAAYAMSDADKIDKLKSEIEYLHERIGVLESKKNGSNDAKHDDRIDFLESRIEYKQSLIDELAPEDKHQEPEEQTGWLSDGTLVSIRTSAPTEGDMMEIEIWFDAEHVNYDVMATQNGEEVLHDEGIHVHEDHHIITTAPLSSADPVDITVTFQGYGLPDSPGKTGPIGEVAFGTPAPVFHATTDKEVYKRGETVHISGHTGPVIAKLPDVVFTIDGEALDFISHTTFDMNIGFIQIYEDEGGDLDHVLVFDISCDSSTTPVLRCDESISYESHIWIDDEHVEHELHGLGEAVLYMDSWNYWHLNYTVPEELPAGQYGIGVDANRHTWISHPEWSHHLLEDVPLTIMYAEHTENNYIDGVASLTITVE